MRIKGIVNSQARLIAKAKQTLDDAGSKTRDVIGPELEMAGLRGEMAGSWLNRWFGDKAQLEVAASLAFRGHLAAARFFASPEGGIYKVADLESSLRGAARAVNRAKPMGIAFEDQHTISELRAVADARRGRVRL